MRRRGKRVPIIIDEEGGSEASSVEEGPTLVASALAAAPSTRPPLQFGSASSSSKAFLVPLRQGTTLGRPVGVGSVQSPADDFAGRAQKRGSLEGGWDGKTPPRAPKARKRKQEASVAFDRSHRGQPVSLQPAEPQLTRAQWNATVEGVRTGGSSERHAALRRLTLPNVFPFVAQSASLPGEQSTKTAERPETLWMIENCKPGWQLEFEVPGDPPGRGLAQALTSARRATGRCEAIEIHARDSAGSPVATCEWGKVFNTSGLGHPGRSGARRV